MDDLIFFAMLVMSVLINLCSIDDALIDVIAFGIVALFACARGPGRQAKFRPWESLSRTGVKRTSWARWSKVTLRGSRSPACGFIWACTRTTPEPATSQWRLPKRHPDRVRVIVNTLAGPTSKGQMLNEMFRQVYTLGRAAGNGRSPRQRGHHRPAHVRYLCEVCANSMISSRCRFSRSIPPSARWSRPPIWTNSRSATPGR